MGGDRLRARWPQSAGSIESKWLVLATIIALLAVASIANAAISAQRNGCIFDDGVAYCRMAEGEHAAAPFSRRVLVPALASRLSGGSSIVDGFELIAMVASAATVA